MKTLPTLLLVMAASLPVEGPAKDGDPGALLADLAARADLVALAQVKDTDYFRRRDIPVSGSAYLKMLIPYKRDTEEDLVEVYEKGLHEHECYFPNPDVFEEGRRYLLFLQRDPEDTSRYRGLPEGCALDVLVTAENRYALRYPLTGIEVADPLENVVQTMEFSDGYAVVDDEGLPPALRESMLAAGQLRPWPEAEDVSAETPDDWLPGQEPAGRQWRYTQGIELGEIRRLIKADTLAD